MHSDQVMTLVKAGHVPGVGNSLADALSHKQIEWSGKLDPGANKFMETLPPEVWQIGVMMRKDNRCCLAPRTQGTHQYV